MLTCQLVTAVDPHHPEDKSHVCLRALTTGIYGFQQMASDISHATSLTEADALAAMKAFVTFTRNALVNGRNVELEGLGLLRLCIGSRMTPAAVAGRKNFRLHSIIKDIRVAFLPSPSLKAFVTDNTKVVLKKGGPSPTLPRREGDGWRSNRGPLPDPPQKGGRAGAAIEGPSPALPRREGGLAQQ